MPRTKKDTTPTLPEGIEQFQTIITVCIPLNPTSNHSYDIRNITTKTGKQAHTLMCNTQYASYKKTVAAYLNEAYLNENATVKNTELIDRIIDAHEKNKTVFVPVAMDIIYYLPSVWKSDIDGRVKGTMDAIFKHIGLNDKLTCDLHVRKKLVPPDAKPWAMVDVYTLPANTYL